MCVNTFIFVAMNVKKRKKNTIRQVISIDLIKNKGDGYK